MFMQWKQCCECGSVIPAIASCLRSPECGSAYRYVAGPALHRTRAPVTLEQRTDGAVRASGSRGL